MFNPFSAITNLFAADSLPGPDSFEDYYTSLLCGERVEVYNPHTGAWQTGHVKDVAESVYLGEADVYRAFWVADDGSCSDWLLVDDVLNAVGLA